MKFFTKKTLWIALGVVLIGGIGFALSNNEKTAVFDFVEVKKSDIKQEVSITGKITSAQDVELAFEKSGKISQISHDIGAKVAGGSTLVVLENSDLQIELERANAGIEIAQAQLKNYEGSLEFEESKLAELLKGPKVEEIQVAQTQVDNAEKTLADSQTNLENLRQKAELDLANIYADTKDIIADAFTKTDDAVRQQIDELFREEAGQYRLTFSFGDSNLALTLEYNYGQIKKEADVLKVLATSITPQTSQQELDILIKDIEDSIAKIQIFINQINEALNKSLDLPAATLNTYKLNANTARININAALASVRNHQQLITSQKKVNENTLLSAQIKINEAQNAILTAKAQLELKKIGSTPEAIAGQKARIKQAQASIAGQKGQIRDAVARAQGIRVQIGKTVIVSPFSGTIIKQDAKVGEIVNPGKIMVSLFSANKFIIEAYIPEADISKVQVGDKAKLTLDAYGNEATFEAKVIIIEPAETIREGVTNYKTTLELEKDDNRIKSGMTANIDIGTEERQGVITVPQRAVTTEGDKKFVKIVDETGKTTKEIEVKTGLRGSDGNIEITEGLKEGDKVVVFEEEE